MGKVVMIRNAKLSRAEKLRAFDLMIEHNAPWFYRAVREIGRLPAGWTGTGEDLRYKILESIEKPKDQHIWGPVTARGEQLGWLARLDKRGRMRQISSHARSTDRYIRTEKEA